MSWAKHLLLLDRARATLIIYRLFVLFLPSKLLSTSGATEQTEMHGNFHLCNPAAARMHFSPPFLKTWTFPAMTLLKLAYHANVCSLALPPDAEVYFQGHGLFWVYFYLFLDAVAKTSFLFPTSVISWIYVKEFQGCVKAVCEILGKLKLLSNQGAFCSEVSGWQLSDPFTCANDHHRDRVGF